MANITDSEFGTITIRRSAKASHVSIRVAPNGTLRASLPLYAPLFLVKKLVKDSRDELRDILEQQHAVTMFEDGMRIGKSHTLIVRPALKALEVKRHRQHIVVSLPATTTLQDPSVTRHIRPAVIAALRLEAKSYLPKRLKYIADQYGYSYDHVRFSHASGRWGSCSSNGTISLNIALMKLPFELIDYVLIHELSHTRQMNHSEKFWQLVAQADPNYKLHRAALKQETPSI